MGPSFFVLNAYLPLILTLLGTVALSLLLKYKSRILNCDEENKEFVKEGALRLLTDFPALLQTSLNKVIS